MTDTITINQVDPLFTPEVGARGTYKLLPPFDTVVTEAIYTCKGIERISKLIAAGVDVYNDFYAPYGLTEEKYDNDVMLDRSIVTLISDAGTIATFPVGFMATVPNMNGVVYQRKIIQAGLPPMPQGISYTSLETKIKTLILSELGVDAVVAIVDNSELQLVPFEKHEVSSANRNNKKNISTPALDAETWRQRYEAVLAERDSLLDHFSTLP